MTKYKGQIGLIFVAIIWGTGFVVSAVAIDYYNAFQIMALRFLLAAILISGIFWKYIKKITKRTLLKGSILGIVLYLAFLFQTIGLGYTTPSKNAFLTAVNVVLVPFLGFIFFKIPITRKVILGATMAIIGIGILSLNGFDGINYGDLLTLVCAVFFALQILLTNIFLKEEHPICLNIVQLATAGVVGTIISLLMGHPLLVNNLKGNLAIFYLGAISTMLAYLIQTVSQKYTSSTEAAVILSMEAFFGMLASVIFLKEHITSRMIVGACLIFFGILITEWKPKKAEVKKNRGEKLEQKKTNN